MRNQTRAYRLAASGAIGDSAIDFADVALFAADFMSQRYPRALLSRYKLTELPDTPNGILEEIGRRRGCLTSGGEIDRNRAAEAFLRELRGGMLGRVSLEKPGEDFEEETAGEKDDETEGV
jgi:ribosome biogenesis GTPase A